MRVAEYDVPSRTKLARMYGEEIARRLILSAKSGFFDHAPAPFVPAPKIEGVQHSLECVPWGVACADCMKIWNERPQ